MSVSYPLISVVIPTLNRSEMLLNAIKSVDDQTYQNIEIIVVDDFSDCPVIINVKQFRREIIVIRNSKRLGGGASRNKGVDNSSGKYVCFLDDDDTYNSHKLSFLYDKFDLIKDVDVIFGSVTVNGKIKRNKYLTDNTEIKKISSLSGLHTNGSLFNKNVFKKNRFLETLKKYQDTQLHIELILEENVRVYFFDEVIANWNKSHGYGQITDLQNNEQYIKGLNAFILMEKYFSKKYKLSFVNKIHFFKMKIFIYSKCKANNVFIPELNFYERIISNFISYFIRFSKR